MPHAKICLFPHPVLRKPCQKVEAFDASIEQLLKVLVQTMKLQPSGIGIAAPQIGVSLRVAIVDVSERVKKAERMCLINPVILEKKDEILSREGCMSLPDYTANIKRAERLVLKWQDLGLKDHQMAVEGLEARCIQHEVDHLNGMLFVDRAASLKSDVFRRKRYL